MRNRKIETAKLACFLSYLSPSLIRVVRRKKIERTERKVGMAIAKKVMILKKLSTIQSCAEGNWFQYTLVGRSRERSQIAE